METIVLPMEVTYQGRTYSVGETLHAKEHPELFRYVLRLISRQHDHGAVIGVVTK